MSLHVEVFATRGCGRCAKTTVLLDELALELGRGRIAWRKVNLVEEADYAASLGVLSTPAIAIDGELVFTGPPTRDKLREAIEQRLAAASS